jgi:hypothetical protein
MPGDDLELLGYDMPLTRIIEDNSLKMMDEEDERLLHALEFRRVEVPLFHIKSDHWRTRIMRNAISRDRTIHITRTTLVEKLKGNREQHRIIFEEALEGYKKAAAEYLNGLSLAAQQAGMVLSENTGKIEEVDLGKVMGNPPPFPRNSLEAYDEAIMLFETDESEKIELTVQEVRCYIMDKWDWTRDHLLSNARYSKTAALRAAELS